MHVVAGVVCKANNVILVRISFLFKYNALDYVPSRSPGTGHVVQWTARSLVDRAGGSKGTQRCKRFTTKQTPTVYLAQLLRWPQEREPN